MTKTAVILFNLGGPGSPDSIYPFLKNFFMDKNIIRLPEILRRIVAERIARRRSGREAAQSYALLGGRSPLLENMQAQADALQKILGDGFHVFVCMRYWHPMADEIARKVKQLSPDKIMLLPLYPQASTTTTRSAFEAWDRAAKAISLSVETQRICCYPCDSLFVDASAALMGEVLAQAENETGRRPRVLFSAHGLPESVIRDGDPYQWQCERSAMAIAGRLGLNDNDWVLCYQSRIGSMRWIEPSTEDEIGRAGRDGVPVAIYPLAFTQEHVETLVEIEIEYRHLAAACGVPGFYRVPTVGVHPVFIEGLAALVKDAGSGREKFCAGNFRRCMYSAPANRGQDGILPMA